MEENRKRIDALMVSLGVAPSREKAKEMIKSGNVYLNGKVVSKAGLLASDCDIIEYKGESERYVSRGGLKLEKAVDVFKLDLSGYLCIDIGASTGGFTDCMLQNGAKKVYSVDVGYGQLAWKLRTDSRVKVVERINIKKCFDYDIYAPSDERPDFCATDLSFISIKKVLENILTLMKPENIEIVTLIKPQFEAGREEVGKNGVVRDKNVHIKVIKNVIDFAESIGLTALDLTVSPIKGPAGNIEYLTHLSDKAENKKDFSIEDIVMNTEIE